MTDSLAGTGDDRDWGLEVRQVGDRIVLCARGELDLGTSPLLLAEVERRIAAGARDIVIDLTDLAFLDSTGLGTLVGSWRRARQAGGSLELANPNTDVAMTLKITGLDRVLPISSD